MRRAARAAAATLLAACGYLLAPAAGFAQPAPSNGGTAPATRPGRREPGRPGSFEVSAGFLWIGPSGLGDAAASMATSGGSSAFTAFDVSARMGGSAGIDARVAWNLARHVAVEAGFAYSAPPVRFTVSGDSEAPATFTSTGERLSQYLMDGSVLVFPPGLAFSRGRGRTFVGAGAGYLRQLHEGRFNVENGVVAHAGAGVKYAFRTRPAGLVKGLGLRAELRAYYRSGGYGFDGRDTWSAAAGFGLFAAF